LANIIFKDGYGYEKVRKATGSGTQADPFIPVYEVEADLTFTTPVPIVGAGIDIPITMDGEPLEDTAAGDLAAINLAATALAVATPDTAAGDFASIASDISTLAATLPDTAAGDLSSIASDISTLASALPDTASGDLSSIASDMSTLASTLPDTTGGDLSSMAGDLSTLAGAVSTQMQCDIVSELPAGTKLIGIVGIDQTGPGTTNGVAIVGTKGAVTTAHNAIESTATSAEIDCTGYNGLIVHASMTDSKEWVVKVTGSPATGGTFIDCYDAATQMTLTSDVGKCILWKGVPEFVKIVATENSDGGTCTVKVQPVMI
jgi:hypothetical protein